MHFDQHYQQHIIVFWLVFLLIIDILEDSRGLQQVRKVFFHSMNEKDKKSQTLSAAERSD